MTKKKAEESTIEEKINNALIPVDKQPYEIPKNWCWVHQGSICNLVKGEKIYNVEYPYLDVKYLRGLKNKKIIDNGNFVPIGTKLILVDGENSGEVFTAIEDGYMGSTFKILKSKKNVNVDYLDYFILTKKDFYKQFKRGTAIPHLDKALFNPMPFPLPPLAEQERIVNKLDNYISKLNEAKEKLEKVVDTYNYRKNLILYRAFTGQLTKNWRKENKFELNEDIKKKAITKDSMLPDEYLYEIPENWRWVRLGEINIRVIDGDRGKNYPKKKKEFFSEGYCIFLNAKNVTKDGFNFDNLEYITKEKDELLRSGRLNRGDIVMTTRGTIGNIALYDNSIIYDKLRINSGMVIFRSEFEITKKYIIYLWQSMLIKNQINILTTGTAQPQLPIKDLKKIHFPLPPIEEQKEIVKILDSVLSKEKQIKEIAEKEIERVEDLKKNLLTRAFGGVLGTNDPNEENSIELLKTVL